MAYKQSFPEYSSALLNVLLKSFIMKRFFKSVWQFCSHLFWPQWGKKHREAQQAYEDRLEEK